MSEISIIFVFMAVMAGTIVVFAVWLFFMLLRLIWRGFSGVFLAGMDQRPLSSPVYHCPRRGCQALNPASARFCRRCGRELLRSELRSTCC